MFDRVLEVGSVRCSRAVGITVPLAVAAVLAAPSAALSQGGQGQGGQAQTLRELQRVSQQLQKIRKQAMQDSALRAQRDELTAYIRSELKSLSDSTAARVDSMMTLQKDLRAAQQSRDTAGARSAVKDLKRLQKAISGARKQVMGQPDVQKRLEAYRQAVRARMREMSPKADSLLELADSLQAELRGGAGGSGG